MSAKVFLFLLDKSNTLYFSIMKNSLNNVDRGMNIAVINGKTGESIKQIVFDLYGKGKWKSNREFINSSCHGVVVIFPDFGTKGLKCKTI